MISFKQALCDGAVLPSGRLTRVLLLMVCVSVMSLGLAACGEASGGSNTSAAEIRKQEALWRSAVIDNYEMQYKVRCLCPTKNRRVMVRGGRIERVDYKSVDPAIKHDYYHDNNYYHEDYVYTVDRLFDIAHDAHAIAHAVQVRWHPTLGFPVEMRIDWKYNGIDDEYQILVIDFYAP